VNVGVTALNGSRSKENVVHFVELNSNDNSTAAYNKLECDFQ